MLRTSVDSLPRSAIIALRSIEVDGALRIVLAHGVLSAREILVRSSHLDAIACTVFTAITSRWLKCERCRVHRA